uniref:Uncharacterized protein n=1 Tax=Panagrolaimus sp. ES5 TaxID=591445 RepID=A0AC34FB62_9BILA
MFTQAVATPPRPTTSTTTTSVSMTGPTLPSAFVAPQPRPTTFFAPNFFGTALQTPTVPAVASHGQQLPFALPSFQTSPAAPPFAPPAAPTADAQVTTWNTPRQSNARDTVPSVITPIPVDPSRHSSRTSTTLPQHPPHHHDAQTPSLQQQPYRSSRLSRNGLADILFTSNGNSFMRGPEVVPETPPFENFNPVMDSQWRKRFSEYNVTEHREEAPQNVQPAAVATTYDQIYNQGRPSAAKIAFSVDAAQFNNMHDVFFNGKIDPRKKLERMLELMHYEYDNTRRQINIDTIFAAQICRSINDEHAEDLALRLHDAGEGNFSTIINHSFFVVYEETDVSGAIRYGTIDGNNRLAGVQKYNENVSTTPITSITVDYVLTQRPTVTHAIVISTLASNEAEKDRFEYDQKEILRNARLILKNECELLKIVPVSDSSISPQQWQREYEKIVREELSKLLKVDIAKIYSSIWRLVQIPDNHFEIMLQSLADYGTSIIKIQKMALTYKRRPHEMLGLCSEEHEDADEFFEQLDEIKGSDWDQILKEKKAYDENRSEVEHAQIILGDAYNSYELAERNTCLENFLQWKGLNEMARQKSFPDPNAKLNFLATKFPIWLEQDVAAKKRKSGHARGGEESDEEDVARKKGRKSGRKASSGASKKVKNILQMKPIEMDKLRADFFDNLQTQPHVAGLLSFCLKSNSKNLLTFPDNNVVRRCSSNYETPEGNFDWPRYNAAIGRTANENGN